ncbi:MAG: NAD+ synthase [Plesiomonas sp.]
MNLGPVTKQLNIAIAQLNMLVGDIEGNADKIIHTATEHANTGADMVVFPELALTGYPPEDLLLRPDLMLRVHTELQRIQQACAKTTVLVGHPWRDADALYNALSVYSNGQLLTRYYKQQLPNYGVFDEQRYFRAGHQPAIIDFAGYRIGLLICEDLWFDQPIDTLHAAGAELIISINASPYDQEKPQTRQRLLEGHCRRTGLPLIYVNQVGGQDELVFDGCSKVFNQQGEVTHHLAAFAEDSAHIIITDNHIQPMPTLPQPSSLLAQTYQALVLAVRDYVTKNAFHGAVLGLSGGIDSALTLAIAADALGAENVQAVMMPFRYTADISVADAKEEAEILGVEFDIISIEPMFDAFMNQLAPLFAGTARDTTEENLQARCRGVMLMAISNKRRRLVLTTGNKSEMAVGYATLYGDMAGGFDVLKDVPKTLVFALSAYRNTLSYVIPQRVIDRPPSAELAPDQVDQDSLPPYDVLDAILQAYVEHDKSVAELIAMGFDETIVRKVLRLVDINEYKRRQSAVGPRITTRNFGKDRRYPITSGFGRKNW